MPIRGRNTPFSLKKSYLFGFYIKNKERVLKRSLFNNLLSHPLFNYLFPFSYGVPNALGESARPINPVKARIVKT